MAKLVGLGADPRSCCLHSRNHTGWLPCLLSFKSVSSATYTMFASSSLGNRTTSWSTSSVVHCGARICNWLAQCEKPHFWQSERKVRTEDISSTAADRKSTRLNSSY